MLIVKKDNSPFIDFDPDSCKFNLNADVAFIEKGAKIYFNSRLYELLSSYPARSIGYPGDKEL